MRTVHLGALPDPDLVRKSCYVNARTDESVLFGLHVPGEEYLAVLVVVKAVAVVERIRTAERSGIAVHEYAKTCKILGLVFKNCFLGNCFCDFLCSTILIILFNSSNQSISILNRYFK